MKKILYRYKRQEHVLDTLHRVFCSMYLFKYRVKFYEERGYRMAVFANDLGSTAMHLNGLYERVYLESLMSFIAPIREECASSCAVDIGANIGNHSIFFSRFFREVRSFEPNPSVFELLQLNARHPGNVIPYNMGISDKDEELILNESGLSLGASSAVYEPKNSTNKIKIQVKPLDEMSIDWQDIGLIKIDVEGMEYNVVNGSLQTIKKAEPIIIFEQHEADFDGKSDGTKTTRLLSELGYIFAWLDGRDSRKSRILKRLKNIGDIFAGNVTYEIVTADILPKGFYNMIIAILESKKHRLSI